MKKLLLMMVGMCLHAVAQTTVTGPVLVPFGSETFTGTIVITSPNQLTWNGDTYVGWKKSIEVTNGDFSRVLIPNVGAQPTGTSYMVVYSGQGKVFTEFWVVPNSGTPVKISSIRVATAPLPSMVVQLSQLALAGVSGDCLKRSSNGWTTGVCGGGGTWGSISGTLSEQPDLWSALNGKEPSVTGGTSLQVWLGNKTWQNISGLSIDWSQIFNTPTFFNQVGYGLQATGTEVSADDAELVSYQWSASDPAGVGALGKLHIRPTTGELFVGDGSQWLGLAKKVHTHVAADISDFTAAARAAFGGSAGRITITSGVIDLASGVVAPGACVKGTVDTYGRVTGCAALVSGDLPSHTHDAGDVATGILLPPRGGTGNTAPAANEVLIGNASGGYTKTTLPDCSNGTTSKLLYNNTSRVFSCGTDQSGGGTFIQNLHNNFAGNTVATVTTTYGGFNGVTSYGTEPLREIILGTAGTLKNLYVRTGSAQPGTGDLVVTVRKNGSATSLTLTVAASSVAAIYSDLSNTVSVAAGDRIAIQFAEGTGTSAQINAVTLGFQQ